MRAAQRNIHAAKKIHEDHRLANIGATARIVGPLDHDLFWRAADFVARHSPALRSSLHDSVDGMFQIVHDDARVARDMLDLRAHADPHAAARRFVDDDFERRPFASDGREIANSMVLIRVGDTEHIAYAKYDHALFDGWATSRFYTLLCDAYNRLRAGGEPVAWRETHIDAMLDDERAYLSSDKCAASRRYWAERLASYDSTYFRRATSLPNRRTVLELTAHEAAEVRAWAGTRHANAFHFFAAVLHATLFRVVAARDLAIGLPILNRRTATDKQTIGLFLGFCVLRTAAAPADTFTDLVARIAAQLKADFRHQRYPLDALAGEQGRLPFEVSLSYEKHDYDATFDGTSTTVTPLRTPAQSYPLRVYVRDFDTRRPIFVDFDTNDSCFGDLTPKALVETFRSVMREALDDTNARLVPAKPSRGDAPAARPPATPMPRHANLCSAFEAIAARHPADIAVSGGAGSLTYAQLDARANALAASLRALGAGPEQRIGLCSGRDLHFAIGMLAILKTGSAYVPLDPAYPGERLRFLIDDSAMIAIVGMTGELDRLPPHDLPRRAIELDDDDAPHPAPPRTLCADQAAYVIYTSGSTGAPKGCVVTHANVLRLFDVTRTPFELSSNDVWSVFHSTAFDFSVWELWGALLHGARAVFVPYDTSRDPLAFAGFLRDHRVSVLSQTPSAFRLLDRQHARLPALRLVVFGGEALAPASLRDWFDRYGDVRPRLVNMYGITETTVHVTARSLRRDDADSALSPIGDPLADLSLHILDPHGEPALDGVAGEIHVGGPGVARGYLNRPGLTAARFVPDPAGPPGARRYRAGDLARRRADGEIEYLGRADQQIKIRGFRIEPAEIEAALRLHPAVRDAAVVCDADAHGNARLVAYVTRRAIDSADAASDSNLPPGTLEPAEPHHAFDASFDACDAAALRAHLAARVPAHMIPAHFVALAALPLTVNGKLDRRALPAPKTLLDTVAHTPPVTPTERLLADIWTRVLGRSPSRHDSFFALGGDSINSLAVITGARAQGVYVSPRQLRESPTLEALAEAVDRDPQWGASAPAALMPFELLTDADRASLPDGLEDALPMSRLQLGMLFHRERDGGAVFHDVFRYRLRIAAWDEAAWRGALAAATRAHAALRTVFALDGFSAPLQLIRREAAPALQVFDCRALDDAAQRAALRAFVDTEQQHDFDVAHGPMLRLFIHRVADDAIDVTLSFHHAIVDGWSVASLMTGIIVGACGGRTAAPESDAPVLALHAAAERDALANDALRRAWRERLAHSPATLLANGDANERRVPRAPDGRRTVERVVRRMPSALSLALVERARALGVELRSLLLAAHLRTLSMLTGSDRPVTGYVVHNRPDHPRSARATGLFLNTVPFGARLAPGSWAALIRQVAAADRELDALKRLPLAAIADEAGATRLFDVAFNYIHFHVYRDALALPGVAVVDFEAREETDFPLLVQFARNPADNRVDVSLHYDVAHFAAPSIERHLAILDAALRDVAADVDASWLAMPVAGVRDAPAARPPATPMPRHANLCSAFEAVAARHPAAIAVSGDAGSLTYAQLDARANALAASLRALGAGPEQRIGLCSGRDLHFAIGMLAILKTGSAYVPLDPAYPGERLRFLIDDSAMIAIVGMTSELDRLPPHPLPRRAIELDDDDAPHPAPPRTLCADQAAYVIYTSGSTGTPKGCVVTHANVLRLFDVTRTPFELSSNDVWSVFHSTAFDFSVWELWGALLHGARAVFVPYDTSRDPLAFAGFLRDHRVSVLSQTPSAFHLLDRQHARLPALRLVVFGGEALAPASLRDWFDRYGDVRPRLVNMYGITETTVHVTARSLRRDDADSALSPIGGPLADLSLHILDPHGEPALDGVAGEIHVGGPGVARGYLNRPGLTAARFVPDPAGPPGARRYRAGDLARRRADGEIEYLGRADQQIKIRGFRIEPAEIEAALRLHPAVRDAAVVCDADAHGNARLVAYVTRRAIDSADAARDSNLPPGSLEPAEPHHAFDASFDACDAAALRAHLAARVPAHMIPAHFVALAALPLTVNGKLDRRALPAPETRLDAVAHAPPVTPTERLLADIWTRVLGRSPSRHDSFFALGGDSIASLKALNAARHATGIDLPLQGMFAQPTLHALAAWIDSLAADAREPDAPSPVRRAPRVRARISAGQDGSRLTTLDKAL
ncbi:hypothetical protein WS71_20550 [Burkholderia mayonis]|uniref:Carrier domain-containing protein n=1 Tax=Burkholderia mayonis TaxID=1385591 RepID=A0A1B4G180_9BURK|nr:hypothetical protein WS71_20550 [Burkholderia mayonis]KVE52317.1 hypothetical protein WS71_10375 [Burkholderia mayonis]